MNKIKSILVKVAASAVLAIAPLVGMGGISSATAVGGTVNWDGNGADSVKACDTGQTPYLHWIFTTGGDDSITAVTLTVSGDASGSGSMTQHGNGSWTRTTSYSGTGQPTTSTLTASAAYTGEPGEGTPNLVISDGCFGTGGEGGGPTMDCDGDFDNSPASECTTGQVLGTTTTPGKGAVSNQVSVVPQGSVNGGGGAASSTVSKVSAIGLFGSLFSAGAGLALLNRRQS